MTKHFGDEYSEFQRNAGNIVSQLLQENKILKTQLKEANEKIAKLEQELTMAEDEIAALEDDTIFGESQSEYDDREEYGKY